MSLFWNIRKGFEIDLLPLDSSRKITLVRTMVCECQNRVYKFLVLFCFKSDMNLAYKTLITQEMLKKGFLASNLIYVSTVHNPEIINRYFDALDSIFKKIKECENGLNVLDILEGPICHSGFSRLN